jgi:hypothetical protein
MYFQPLGSENSQTILSVKISIKSSFQKLRHLLQSGKRCYHNLIIVPQIMAFVKANACIFCMRADAGKKKYSSKNEFLCKGGRFALREGG